MIEEKINDFNRKYNLKSDFRINVDRRGLVSVSLFIDNGFVCESSCPNTSNGPILLEDVVVQCISNYNDLLEIDKKIKKLKLEKDEIKCKKVAK